jgi:Uma2 family endonuclease
MARRHAIISDENLRIPEDAFTYDGFLRWVESGEFPETGRIDYLQGDLEAEMSPEDLYSHGAVKAAIGVTLGRLVLERDLGEIFIDRTRVRSRFAELSVEPDVLVVLESSLVSGKVRPAPAAAAKGPGRYIGFEGAPDLVVEIVSDGSVRKDTRRLPALYARAGVPELWLVDARGDELRFTLQTLRDGSYQPVEADPCGWALSPLLGRSFRLLRTRHPRLGTWRYALEERAG